MNFKRLESLLAEKKLSKNQLAGHLNMSVQAINVGINRNSFKIETIIKMADFFKMSVYNFIQYLYEQNLVNETESNYLLNDNYKTIMFNIYQIHEKLDKILKALK